jgi:hypothetical protein
LGSPEQDRVTNIGDASAEGFTGVTVTFTVPALPAVSTRGSVEGDTAASVTPKLGVELACACTAAVTEAEPRWMASPL